MKGDAGGGGGIGYRVCEERCRRKDTKKRRAYERKNEERKIKQREDR